MQLPDSSSILSDQVRQEDKVYSFFDIPIVSELSDPQPEDLTDVIDQGQVQ